MPILNNTQTITLTAGGGTVNLDVSSPIERYVITGTATLTSNWTIQPTDTLGILITGVEYIFYWNANITPNGNTVTLFGSTVPEIWLNKDVRIKAYYNGTTWNVDYIPDFNQSGILNNNELFPIESWKALDSGASLFGTNNNGGIVPTLTALNGVANSTLDMRRNISNVELRGSIELYNTAIQRQITLVGLPEMYRPQTETRIPCVGYSIKDNDSSIIGRLGSIPLICRVEVNGDIYIEMLPVSPNVQTEILLDPNFTEPANKIIIYINGYWEGKFIN